MNILDYIPEGYTPREIQVEFLLWIEKNWDKYDVFNGPLPTASGKSLVAITISYWRKAKGEGTAILNPQVLLQEENYEKPFPEVPSLKGKARYECSSGGTCHDSFEITNTYCGDCPYFDAREAAKESPVAVLNFHSYFMHKMYRDNLIIDEAHNAFPTISSFYTINVFENQEPFGDVRTHSDAVIFLERRIKELNREIEIETEKKARNKLKAKVRNYTNVVNGLIQSPSEFFIEQKNTKVRGRMTNSLRITPMRLGGVPHNFFPRDQVRKIILLSGTFNDEELSKLGIATRRVATFEAWSPIPIENRPVIFIPTATMSYKYQKISIPVIAEKIKEIAADHADTKGIIHLPYALQDKFAELLLGDRYIFHNKDNKMVMYKLFKQSKEPKILVASGMSEGVDLPYEDGRWQIIPKVMYPSLADGLMKKYMNEDSSWYSWLTVRTLVQQTGRICRTPTDFGETFILDNAFKNLIRFNRRLFPLYFLDALKTETK